MDKTEELLIEKRKKNKRKDRRRIEREKTILSF